MTVIDEIKQRTDIVEAISHYGVKLEESGRNYRAICPFHAEKHGSFFVFPDQQRWRCFGACATGGDIISFLMRRESVDFAQALRILADRAGVLLSPADSQKDAERDRIHAVNAAAATYFGDCLASTGTGEIARNYLAKRGISDSSITAFQIGYATQAWEALKTNLSSHGFTENELQSAGLLVERENRSRYDRFRNRLMFPIRDIQGRITGFGGRALDDSTPKYLNSPQTMVFDKSSTLYGIDLAKEAIRKENRVVIVEGYMDVVMAHQYGFNYVVASMGTSLTERQATTLRKLASRFTLAMDPDSAGTDAMLRGVQTIDSCVEHKTVPIPTHIGLIKYESEVDAEISIVALPSGKDPDEVIRQDPLVWKQLVDGSFPVMEYVLKVEATRSDLHQAAGRREVVNRVLPIISEIKEPVRQSHYLQELARLVGLKENTLWEALSAMRKRTGKHKSGTKTELVPISDSSPLEEYCLALILQNPELKTRCGEMSLEIFQDSALREIAGVWLNGEDIDTVKSSVGPALSAIIDRLYAKQLPPTNAARQRQCLDDCISLLRRVLVHEMASNEEDRCRASDAEGPEAAVATLQDGTSIADQLYHIERQPRGETTSET